MSKYDRLNKFDRAAQRKAQIEQRTAGSGLYVFKNHTKGELMLPKPLAGGKTRVAAGEEFQGDSYFLSLVKSNMLLLVREVVSPQQQKKDKEQALLMEQQKLLLDQPETVTTKGKVEHVVVEQPKAVKLNEGKGKKNEAAAQKDVLLNESPADMSGVEIIK